MQADAFLTPKVQPGRALLASMGWGCCCFCVGMASACLHRGLGAGE